MLQYTLGLVLLVVHAVTSAFAQPAMTRLEHLSVEQGLSFNQVNSILQDSRGFMWFGTFNGLNRYDGYSFRVYTVIPGDSTSLPARVANTLFEDSNGDLWVIGMGRLSRYDRARDRFVRYFNDLSVTSLCEDTLSKRTGRELWIATNGGGLKRFDEKTGNVSSYRHIMGSPASLPCDTLNRLFIDRSGVLWMGAQNGLCSFSVKDGRFTRYTDGPQRPVWEVFEDPVSLGGTLWIGAEDGLYRFDRSHRVFTRFAHAQGKRADIVKTIYCDRTGRLWVGSIAGVSRFDRTVGRYTAFQDEIHANSFGGSDGTWHFREDRSGRMYLCSNMTPLRTFDEKRERWITQNIGADHAYSFLSIFEDRTGTMWFGTLSDGVLKLDPVQKRFTTYRNIPGDPASMSSSSATGVCDDETGNIWVGTLGGLNRLDPATGRFVRFVHDPRDPHSLSHDEIWPVVMDKRGALWIGTREGGINRLDRLDRRTGRFDHYLGGEFVSSLYEDREGSLWAGIAGGRLAQFNPTTDAFRFFSHDYSRPAYEIEAIAEDRDGLLWVAVQLAGLTSFNRKTDTWKQYGRDVSSPYRANESGSLEPTALSVDHKGALWVGSPAGLSRYNKSSGTFTTFAANERVSGILEDDRHNLWASVTGGILKLNPAKGVVTTYDARDGVDIGSWSGPTGFKSRSGEMYFGGSNGLVRFHPDSIHDNPNIPPVFITSFSKYDKPVHLDTAIAEKKALELSYTDNMISFEFAALNYTSPEKNQYAYQLVGFDTGWVYCGTRRTATYTNLGDGDYVFRVKGSNNDGVWNKTGASMELRVSSPPWKTTWAYVCYVLLVGGCLYGIRRYQINSIKARHQIELELLETQTLKEVDQAKSRFFANISHELRTPLTLIEGPILQLLSTVNDEHLRAQYELVFRNCRRLLVLVNQLLDLSRLESGRMKFAARWCDMAMLVRGVAASFESLAARRNIAFTVQVPGARVSSYIDEGNIEKSITNLVANAFKFTPDGGAVDVNVRSVQAGRKDAGRVLISVTDTGIGIPREYHEKIFERFFQVNDTAARRFEGTGIGLALARELVELHNGTITVESEPGKGSTFTVAIPLPTVLDLTPGMDSAATRDAVGTATGENLTSHATGENLTSHATSADRAVAAEVVDSLSEIVWAMNPKNDTLENLIGHVRLNTVKYLNLAGITCKCVTPDTLPTLHVQAEVRRNLFLVLQEALHNVVKHSRADTVVLSMMTEGNSFEIIIADNGKGFLIGQRGNTGNGLTNMERRMHDVGGALTIVSGIGEGTRVTCMVSLVPLHEMHNT